MFRPRLALAAAIVLGAAAMPGLALAQYGGSGMGSALSSDPMSHQGQVQAGVADISKRAQSESPFKIIKDVKLGLKDADPNVRVQELKKLRQSRGPRSEQDPNGLAVRPRHTGQNQGGRSARRAPSQRGRPADVTTALLAIDRAAAEAALGGRTGTHRRRSRSHSGHGISATGNRRWRR